MKKNLLILISAVLLCAPLEQARACATCFGTYGPLGGPPPPNVQHIVVAIWFLMGAVGCVLGGVVLFGLHLWRCENRPLSPDEELAEEVSQLTEAYD